MRLLAFAVLLTSCALGPDLADDEIFDDTPPAGAKAGMSITWRNEGGEVLEETWACVAESPDQLVMEERELRSDGISVTTKRFSRDGRLLAACRGPAGGTARPLRIVPAPGLDEYRAKAESMSGMKVADVEKGARSSRSRETLVTPAGTFIAWWQRPKSRPCSSPAASLRGMRSSRCP